MPEEITTMHLSDGSVLKAIRDHDDAEPRCTLDGVTVPWRRRLVSADLFNDARAALELADDLLRRLAEWDMLYVSPEGEPVTADGPYWQGEIARVRAEALPILRGDTA